MADRRRYRVLLAAGVAVALGALAVAWLIAEPPQPELASSVASAASERARRLEADAPRVAGALLDAGRGELVVQVLDEATRKPIAGATVEAFPRALKPSVACPCPADADPADADDDGDKDESPYAGTLLDSECGCEAATLALLAFKPLAPAPLGRKQTDTQGQVRWDADAGIAFVVAEAPGHASTSLSVEDDDDEPTLLLPPAKAVKLALVDEQRAPLASFRARLFRDEPFGEVAVRKDENLLVADAAPGGDLELVVAAPGFRAVKIELAHNRLLERREGESDLTVVIGGDDSEAWHQRGDTIEVTLFAPRVVHGRVTAGGRPVAGAEVRSQTDGIAPVRSDARGRFTLENLPALSELHLIGRAPGLVGLASVLDLDRDREAEADIALQETASLAVTVLDARSGARLDGAEVRLSTELEGAPSPPDPELAEAGTSHFDGLFPTSYEVRIRADGHGPATPTVTLKPAERRRLEVKLEEGLTLKGQVIDSRGQPIADATVFGHAPFEDKGVFPVGVEAVTDADGHFALSGVSAGRVDLDVQQSGYLNTQLEARTDGPEVSVVLLRMATLEGQVLGAQGPARRVRLTLSGRADGGDDHTFRATSNEEGHYAFEIATEGPAKLAAEVSEGGTATEAPVELKPGANHFDLQLDPGGTIPGRVLDTDQRPVAGAKVHTNPAGPPFRHGGRGSHSAVTDAEGHFTLMAVDADLGDYIVGASTETASTSPNAHAHVGDTNVELHLQARPRITGRVVRVTGEPVTEFKVGTQEVASADGSFATWGWPGQRELSLTGPFLPVSVPLGDLDGGAADVGDVKVTQGITLRGQVLDHSGRPARGCRVTARTDWDLDPPGIDPFRETPADDSGHFALEHLQPAHYLLGAHCDHAWARDVPQVVTEGVGLITLSLPLERL